MARSDESIGASTCRCIGATTEENRWAEEIREAAGRKIELLDK
jgi:hypothetical protein